MVIITIRIFILNYLSHLLFQGNFNWYYYFEYALRIKSASIAGSKCYHNMLWYVVMIMMLLHQITPMGIIYKYWFSNNNNGILTVYFKGWFNDSIMIIILQLYILIEHSISCWLLMVVMILWYVWCLLLYSKWFIALSLFDTVSSDLSSLLQVIILI